MSDNQRRLFCQLLFMVLCALPTAVCGYWICHPQSASGWEQTLQAKLGLITSIDSIETPEPYVTVLRGVEFSDPEIGTLLWAVEARIEFGRDENIVTIPYQIQNLTNKSLECLVENLNEHLLRSQDVEKPWRIQCMQNTVVRQQIEVVGSEAIKNGFGPEFMMSNVRIDISRRVEGTSAEASFKVPLSNDPEQTVSCGVERNSEHGQIFGLETKTVELPCWLAADAVSYVATSLGDEATFAGRLLVVPTQGKSQVEINGNFDKVDLQLSVAHLPTQLKSGRIQLQDCFFRNGETIRWKGWLIQGSDEMQISQDELFNFTRQFAPAEAIAGALMQSGRRVADQPSSGTIFQR